MIEEKDELGAKMYKLRTYLCSVKGSKLTVRQQHLLMEQYLTMKKYYDILKIRIKEEQECCNNSSIIKDSAPKANAIE